MKTLVKIIIGLLVIAVLALVVLYFNLDRGVKAAVEEFGPRYTGSPVTLDRVSLSPFSGKGSLYGLDVGNPEGFESPSAFSLEEIDLALETDSLRTDTIVIDTIRIHAPVINYEAGAQGSNLRALQRNISHATATGDSGDTGEGAADKPERKVVIRDFSLASANIRYSNPLLGDESVTLAMPDIHLTGIGEKSGGVTVAEATRQIVAAINREASRAVAESGAAQDLRRQMEDRLEGEKSRVEGVLEGLEGSFGRD